MATMASQGGPVSSSLGLVSQTKPETEEERRRRLQQLSTANPSAGMVSGTVMGPPGAGGY